MAYHIVKISFGMTVTEERPREGQNVPVLQTVNGEFAGTASNMSNAIDEADGRLQDFLRKLQIEIEAGPKRVN